MKRFILVLLLMFLISCGNQESSINPSALSFRASWTFQTMNLSNYELAFLTDGEFAGFTELATLDNGKISYRKYTPNIQLQFLEIFKKNLHMDYDEAVSHLKYTECTQNVDSTFRENILNEDFFNAVLKKTERSSESNFSILTMWFSDKKDGLVKIKVKTVEPKHAIYDAFRKFKESCKLN